MQLLIFEVNVASSYSFEINGQIMEDNNEAKQCQFFARDGNICCS